ncbi:MAG: 30S ribosomal protein S17 [Hydrogenobaculum sp.]|nr:MAG: 30S ribosomal protein S17 [Hydrogenobaculum sp.]PMP90028.1 MAG: 30S ribosomal protein S17 [Hydrogenobaculum sp.]HEK25845.1 30S ribosomal protein S17 [Hydrogenobaculum sp.]
MKEKKWHQKRKEFKGIVVSNKMDKSVVVKVNREMPDPLYGKRVIKSTKFHAHDPENACSIGDVVLIRETRPISKTKRWVVVKILSKNSSLQS